jgi:transposase-like protein
MGLEEALRECDTFVSEDDISWSKIAEKHSVVRSTLTRTYRRETRSQEEKAVAQHKLTLQQEAELVKYIEELTARRIPPTREMIRNFASAVA